MSPLTHRRLWVVVFVALAILGLIAAVLIQAEEPPPPPELVGQLGGAVGAIDVVGQVAYMGMGPRLVIMDMSNPSAPVRLGQTPVLDGRVEQIEVSGGLAFVATPRAFYIVAISSPQAPAIMSKLALNSEGTKALKVAGGFAYLALGESPFWVIDVRDPAHPVKVSSGVRANDIVVVDERAYVLESYGLSIVDVYNPYSLTEMGRVTVWDAADYFTAVWVGGGFAYVVDAYDVLYIIAISDPAAPALVSTYAGVAHATDIVVSEALAYVSGRYGPNGWQGLSIIDVHNFAAPRRLGAVALEGGEHDIGHLALSGRRVYVTAENWGTLCSIVDVQNPTAPTVIDTFRLASDIRDVAKAGRYAYAAAGAYGLEVYDMANPAEPTFVAGLDTPDEASAVFVRDRYAFVADDESGLQIIDVANPQAPAAVSALDTGATWDVYVLGNFAYLANWLGGLRVVDISQPATPQEVGVWTGGTLNAVQVAVKGSSVYAYASGEGLYIIDVTNPTQPTLVKHYHEPLSETHPFPYRVSDIAVRDGYAYLGGEGGLRVIDVSTPSQPEEVGSLQVGADSLDLAGNIAYTTGRYSGDISVIDVFDPAHPRLIGRYWPGGVMGDVYFDDGIFYTAGTSSGMWMLRGPLPAAHSLWLEAENAQLTPPMAATTQTGACNSRYVASAAEWSNGEAAFTIDVPANANYYLWGRVMGLAWNQNSFRVSVDGGQDFHFEIPQMGGQWAWGWTQVHPNLDRILPIGLTAGRHVLHFRAREANARLDAIYVTTHPHLRPNDAVGCQRPATPTTTPTHTSTPTATATPTLAPTPPNSTLVYLSTYSGGSARDVRGQPGLAFVEGDGVVQMVNTSDPYHPGLASDYTGLGWTVEDVHLDGSRAYFAWTFILDF